MKKSSGKKKAFRINIKTKFVILVISSIIISVIVSIIAGVIAINSIAKDLGTRIMTMEMDSLYNHITEEYGALESSGLTSLEEYNKSSQEKIIQDFKNKKVELNGKITVFDIESSENKLENIISPDDIKKYKDIKSNDKIEVENININNDNYLMGYRVFKPWNWIVAITINHNDLYKMRGNYLSNVSIISILIIILMAVMTVLIVGFMTKSIKKLIEGTKKVANGNLSEKININKKDEFGELAKNFNIMVDNLKTMISNIVNTSKTAQKLSKEINSSTEQLGISSEQVSETVSEFAKSATEQAVSTDTGNKLVQDIVHGIDKVAVDMKNSEELSKQAMDTVSKGKELIDLQLKKMKVNKEVSKSVNKSVLELSDHSEKIGNIIGVIKKIGKQTNLLSLNASIEAAKAKEQGKGFSVVAYEIRKLAEQSDNSILEIVKIIKRIQESVEKVVSEINLSNKYVEEQELNFENTVKAFDKTSIAVGSISENINEISQYVYNVSNNTEKTGSEISNIATLSENIASSSQEISATVEEQTAMIYDLNSLISSLYKLIESNEKSTKEFEI